ncbi:hypothetical protein [Saccharothrix algeriensis]|uniref:Uncharacterized protein n=1 Tax=Saccharothrix algeriensis TaxID=173560 RepID=A0A8T8HZJ1_9PSEU|nr:hypothetical protein [Saccharothrix algeriensis]MBM7809713.1 hypothetical protein [Saccharothrix algeriensis]QTR04005.1 hypothetical protein J7S33_03050 [Saccharothrix algeriensis]
MTSTTTRPEHETTTRLGHLVAALVDTALLWVVNVRPGWRSVPFLTAEAGQVVVLVDIALAVGVVVNLVCLARPQRLVRLLGDVLTTAFALVVLWRARGVFPFRFDDPAVDWAGVLRVALPVTGVLVLVAFLVQVVKLVRALTMPSGT